MFKLNSIFLNLIRSNVSVKSCLNLFECPQTNLMTGFWACSFSRLSKPPRQVKVKIKKRGVAISDEKGAKLAKEEEAEEKKKKIEAEKKRIEKSKIKKIPLKTFDMSYDVAMSQKALDRIAIRQARASKGIRAAKDLEAKFEVRDKIKELKAGSHFLQPLINKLSRKKKQNVPLEEFFNSPNEQEVVKPPRLKKKIRLFFKIFSFLKTSLFEKK